MEQLMKQPGKVAVVVVVLVLLVLVIVGYYREGRELRARRSAIHPTTGDVTHSV